MGPFKHVLVPVDFGDAMQPAIDLALTLARTFDAQLTLLHTFDTSRFVTASPFTPMLDTAPVLAALERDLKALREATAARWSRVDACICQGNIYESILGQAKSKSCDLIVIGTHGRRGLAHALLGSIAEKIVQLSSVPVLTVHPSKAIVAASAA